MKGRFDRARNINPYRLGEKPLKKLDYYGRYTTVPKTIQMLLEFEQELKDSGASLDFDLGLIMETEDIRYMSTPPDVIPFARPGVDGIHYGFLTDFGAVTDLEQAFIVCVSPMDFNDCVWIVAKNIQDFLGVVYSESSILYNNFSTIESYQHYMENREAGSLDEDTLPVKERFRERFGIQPIEDMAQYLRELKEQRQKAIVVPTLNQLGVSRRSSQKEHELFRGNGEELEAVRDFLRHASAESKLAFVRDAQTKHLFEDAELRKLLAGELCSMGLADEAKRLELSYT